jgi:RNA polymerase sigma factor (sigma-70 family)
MIRTATGDKAGPSDRDLLLRFAEDGDQAAFATLFRRHAGMVLGVCRRVLSGEQDAEDACQATFLLLSRKAATERWRPSVANWLYLTARRVAGNARVAAQRRARRERKVAVAEAVRPVDRMSARELMTTLDAELDRLPSAFREPLVLCYLEGLTRDEAAHRLGVPPGTLKSRLERGRKRLADALARHGYAAGAALLAFAATAPSRASAARLAEHIPVAASGQVSAAVAALARRAAVNEFVKKSLTFLAVLAGAAALVLGFVSAGLPAGERQEQTPPVASAEKEQPKEAKPADAPATAATKVSGRVLRPDGQPLAGAKLLWIGDEAKEIGVADRDGRFSVALPKELPGSRLAARADGFGIAFVELERVKSSAEVTLRAVPDGAIRGRVVDTEGQPRAGVRVVAHDTVVYPGNSLDSFLAMWKARSFYGEFTPNIGYVDLQRADFSAATTDRDGRFEVRGLGAERVVSLRLSGTGVAEIEVIVVNRAGFDPAPYNQMTREMTPKRVPGGYNPVLYGPVAEWVMQPEKPVRGVVTDADTGKPCGGVRVELRRSGASYPHLAVTTDAEGRFVFRGARKAASYRLLVRPDPVAGFLPRDLQVNDTQGYDPVSVDVKVARGVVVTGRVLDRSTGKGVAGHVETMALVDNPFVGTRPEFDSTGFTSCRTAEDGSFQAVTIPGPVLLTGGALGSPNGPAEWKFKSPVADPDYPRYFSSSAGMTTYYAAGGGRWPVQGNYCKVLEIKPGTRELKRNVLLDPARPLTVSIRDAQGRPLLGAWVVGQSETRVLELCDSDTWTAYGLDAVKPRLAVFFCPDPPLAGTLQLTSEQKQPVIATLRKTGVLKGRLAGPDGKPLAGVTVRPSYRDQGANTLRANTPLMTQVAVTDAGGSFTLAGVLPGLACELTFVRKTQRFSLTPKLRAWLAGLRALTVGSGEEKDLGNLTAGPVEGD